MCLYIPTGTSLHNKEDVACFITWLLWSNEKSNFDFMYSKYISCGIPVGGYYMRSNVRHNLNSILIVFVVVLI